MCEEPEEMQKVAEIDEDVDLRPRFKPLNAVGIVLLLIAIAVSLWQAERDNKAIMKVRARQEAAQGGLNAGKPAWPLDLNTATVRELEWLPGIGPKYAREIVRQRESAGQFTSVDDLLEISGIGAKTLEDIRELVKVVPSPDTDEVVENESAEEDLADPEEHVVPPSS